MGLNRPKAQFRRQFLSYKYDLHAYSKLMATYVALSTVQRVFNT